ncbi:hypothetical protein AB0A63_31520 [Lentzea sp. NPDC042327]
MRPWDHFRVGFGANYETTCSQFGDGLPSAVTQLRQHNSGS